MDDQVQCRTQRERCLRWIGVGAALTGWMLYHLWQRRLQRRRGFAAESPTRSEETQQPASSTEPESEPIEITAFAAPEPLVPQVEAELESVGISPTAKAEAAELAITPDAPVLTLAPDDLCRIGGIGPKVAALLGTAGITTFAQLAAAAPEHLQEILQAAGLRFMDPGTWPQQAALAAVGDWDALAAVQRGLKGGRRV